MQRLSKAFNELTVKKGEVFAIDLDANATTGYLWDMRLTAGKASLVSRKTIHRQHPQAHWSWVVVASKVLPTKQNKPAPWS